MASFRVEIDNYMQGFETAFPATVSAVNSDGTVDALPSVRNCMANGMPEYAGGDVQPIEGVPVLQFGTNAALLRFELSEGDPVLLVASSRELSGWKEDGWGTEPQMPRSFGGNDLNSLVAVPLRREAQPSEPKVTIDVGQDGEISIETSGAVTMTSSKATINNDVEVVGSLTVTDNVSAGGNVSADGEVTAKAGSTNVSLSTHIHPSAMGPTSAPTAGT